MDREEAIEVICSCITDEIVISANGFISRDLFSTLDKSTNFYMIGSMGLASSIGLGVALKNPKKQVIVFDGDGNVLMNLGSLVTIGSLKVKNFIHILFDNHIHESTGGQPTTSRQIKIENIAKESNYKIFSASTKKQLKAVFEKTKQKKGPILISVKIKRGKNVNKRITLASIEIKTRLRTPSQNNYTDLNFF